MLKQADIPVLIRSAVNPLPKTEIENLIITEATGPQGWNDSIMTIIEQINSSQ